MIRRPRIGFERPWNTSVVASKAEMMLCAPTPRGRASSRQPAASALPPEQSSLSSVETRVVSAPPLEAIPDFFVNIDHPILRARRDEMVVSERRRAVSFRANVAVVRCWRQRPAADAEEKRVRELRTVGGKPTCDILNSRPL